MLKKIFCIALIANIVLSSFCLHYLLKQEKVEVNIEIDKSFVEKMDMLDKKMDAMYFDSRERDTILLRLLVDIRNELKGPTIDSNLKGKVALNEGSYGK